jgi:hypothetical protein
LSKKNRGELLPLVTDSDRLPGLEEDFDFGLEEFDLIDAVADDGR